MRAQGLASTASNLSCASGGDCSREGNSTCAFSTGASHPKISRYRRFWACVSLFAAFLWASRRLLRHRSVQKGQIVVCAQRSSQQTLLWLAAAKRSCAPLGIELPSAGAESAFLPPRQKAVLPALPSLGAGICSAAPVMLDLLTSVCCWCWLLAAPLPPRCDDICQAAPGL